MEKKYDVFISYSRKDSAIVEQYYNYLIEAELSVWLDKDGIETGDEFKRTIVRAIKNSDVFLFFSSANSNASSWTVKEVNVAVNCKKRIIPVKLDTTPYEESIMFDLAGLDFFDHANNGFEIGIQKLLSVFVKDYSLQGKNREGEGIKDDKGDAKTSASRGDESNNVLGRNNSATEKNCVDVNEVMASFNGNINQYLTSKVKYPQVAQEQGVQGQVVVSFVVERDGSISNIKVVKSVDPALDEEAVRVISSMPKWNPSTKNGQHVRTNFLLPVSFKLQ